MLHLPSERLAALADEEPTPLEAEHLAACASCATERAAHQRLLATAAAERHQLAPPLTRWDAVATQLRAEGVLTSSGVLARDDDSTVPLRAARRRPSAMRWAIRAAAALALMTGGVLAGRASAGAPMFPSGLVASGPGVDTEAAGDSSDASSYASSYASTGEALVALTNAQREYHRAAAFLAAHDTTSRAADSPDRYRARLAALDQLAETSRQALYEAPADPVLNQYYLSALGAREATIRQMGRALPVGLRLSRF